MQHRGGVYGYNRVLFNGPVLAAVVQVRRVTEQTRGDTAPDAGVAAARVCQHDNVTTVVIRNSFIILCF